MKRHILTIALATTALCTTANAAELRMSWWGGDSRHAATQEALKACGEKHGHTINPEYTGWDGHFEKLTTQIAGKTEADIMQVNWPWLPIYSKNGDGFADLNAFSDTIDLSNWDASQLEDGTRNGKLMAWDNGRLSLMVTISPSLHWFSASCAWSLVDFLTNLP